MDADRTDVEFGFEPFVRAHATSLLRTAVLLTGNRDSGEDLLQETLTYLFPRWQKVADSDQPVAYVRRAIVNRFIGERRSPRRNSYPVRDVPEIVDERDLGDTVATRQAVLHLLATLPHRQRSAVVLRYVYDLTDADIADILGCRVATVRSIVSRTMGVVRQGLLTDGIDTRAGM